MSSSPRWLTPLAAALGTALGAAVIAFLPASTLFVAQISNPEISNSTAAGERWACPMMDFIGQKPGDCPVCGMKMTKVTAGELTAEQQRRMGVATTVIGTGPAVATVHAYGAVRYDDRTLQVVIPRVAGRVVKRHPAALHPGTLVAAGAPVVDLYSPEVFAAQGELAAALKLPDGHSLHALTERFIRWNLLPVATAILQGGAPVDTVTLTTPFAGIVTIAGDAAEGMAPARLPQVGQEVMADTPLLRLVEPRAFMVVVHVPEARAHWLRPGQPVQLSSDDRGPLPDVAASISWVAPELNAEIRAREIHLHLSDPAQRLLVGSLVHARIQVSLTADDLGLPATPSAPASSPAPAAPSDSAAPAAPLAVTLIPKTAVLSTGVRHVAWKVSGRQSDGRVSFALAPLALGPRLESASGLDVYVVRAGLQPGDEVATQGAFLIDAQSQLAGTPSLLFPLGAAPAAPHQH
jgi:Cu(I)/Ag(I) efflux system membrane fusion protein